MQPFKYELILNEYIDINGITFWEFQIVDIDGNNEVLYLSNKYTILEKAIDEGNKILDLFIRNKFVYQAIDDLPF